MKRDELKPSEKFVFPRLTRVIQEAVDGRDYADVTVNMLLALAVHSTSGVGAWTCGTCGDVKQNNQIIRSTELLRISRDLIRAYSTINSGPYTGMKVKFHTELCDISHAATFTKNFTDPLEGFFVLSSDAGTWQTPMRLHLNKYAPALWDKCWDEFKSNEVIQARTAAHILQNCASDNPSELPIWFTRFHTRGSELKITNWGAECFSVYQRICRATGQR